MTATIRLAASPPRDEPGLGHTWEKEPQRTAFKSTQDISCSPGENYVHIQHHRPMKKTTMYWILETLTFSFGLYQKYLSLDWGLSSMLKSMWMFLHAPTIGITPQYRLTALGAWWRSCQQVSMVRASCALSSHSNPQSSPMLSNRERKILPGCIKYKTTPVEMLW